MYGFFGIYNDQSLSQTQIVFVKKVIDYIVQNGYIDNIRPSSSILIISSSSSMYFTSFCSFENRLNFWALVQQRPGKNFYPCCKKIRSIVVLSKWRASAKGGIKTARAVQPGGGGGLFPAGIPLFIPLCFLLYRWPGTFWRTLPGDFSALVQTKKLPGNWSPPGLVKEGFEPPGN